MLLNQTHHQCASTPYHCYLYFFLTSCLLFLSPLGRLNLVGSMPGVFFIEHCLFLHFTSLYFRNKWDHVIFSSIYLDISSIELTVLEIHNDITSLGLFALAILSTRNILHQSELGYVSVIVLLLMKYIIQY